MRKGFSKALTLNRLQGFKCCQGARHDHHAAGTDTAIETADVALMQDDLRKLPEFIALPHRVGNVLRANIAFAIGTKAVSMVMTFTGHASLWLAILADMGASLVVVFNGLRLLRPTARGIRSSDDTPNN